MNLNEKIDKEKSLLISQGDIIDLFFNVMYEADMDEITRQFENDIVKTYLVVDSIPLDAFGDYCNETENKSNLARALVNNLEIKYFCKIAEALKKEVEEWIK